MSTSSVCHACSRECLIDPGNVLQSSTCSGFLEVSFMKTYNSFMLHHHIQVLTHCVWNDTEPRTYLSYPPVLFFRGICVSTADTLSFSAGRYIEMHRVFTTYRNWCIILTSGLVIKMFDALETRAHSKALFVLCPLALFALICNDEQ